MLECVDRDGEREEGRRVERDMRPSIPLPSIPAEGDPRRSNSRLMDDLRGTDSGVEGMREMEDVEVEGRGERGVAAARREARVGVGEEEGKGVSTGLVEGEDA